MEKKDVLKVAGNVTKPKLENEKVRVLATTFKPGEAVKTHHHPDNVVLVLKGGKLKMTSEGKSEEMNLIDGQVVFFKAQDHEVENTGKTTIELIVVELKK